MRYRIGITAIWLYAIVVSTVAPLLSDEVIDHEAGKLARWEDRLDPYC